MSSIGLRAASPFTYGHGRVSPTHSGSSPSSSLNHAHISTALLKSPDGGNTLDFSNMELGDFGEEAAEELASVGRSNLAEDSPIWRMAMAYNRLTSLPMAFSLLTRLRYLNLRNNSFVVFPEVLTKMPSLEILDIGRNKLLSLPASPGHLMNLKILCFRSNRLTELPHYLTKCRRLICLRLENNPLEYPPKSITHHEECKDQSRVMQDWVSGLLKWMESNPPNSLPSPKSSRQDDDSHSTIETSDSEGFSEDNLPSWEQFLKNTYRNDNTTIPHSRTSSTESGLSQYSELSRSDAPLYPRISHAKTITPPSIGEDSLTGRSDSLSSSPDSYLPTPDSSIRLTNDVDIVRQHERGTSFPIPEPGLPVIVALKIKKSLPNMRHPAIRSQTKNSDDSSTSSVDDMSLPPPYTQRDSPLSSNDTLTRRMRPDAGPASSGDRRVPSIDGERNSYFRRMSMLRPASLPRTIPPALMTIIDAARTILYAVSQIHQTLRHYTINAIDERLSMVLTKVLDPAGDYIQQLINALDQFDANSQRGLPAPHICRGVFESCKHNIAMAGKAVSVLKLQLKVFAANDDDRYTRTMITSLYGSMGEISLAWTLMAPSLKEVAPLLAGPDAPPFSQSRSTISVISETDEERMTASSSGEQSLKSQSSVMARQPISSRMVSLERKHSLRRQGGSFSMKDLEIGRDLPSYDPPFTNGSGPAVSQPSTLTMRPSRTPATAVSNHPAPTITRLVSRSTVLSGKAGHIARITTNTSTPLVDSSKVVDKDVMGIMESTVESAYRVWSMVADILRDEDEPHDDLRESLAEAQAVTDVLSASIQAELSGMAEGSRKKLREEAHIFVKIVVHIATQIMNFAHSHPLSQNLRGQFTDLTQSTQELVMLLHVSSFSPMLTPRSQSPMIGVTPNTPALSKEDPNLKSGLSRSRSAQASTAAARPVTPQVPKDVPWTALPDKTFQIPPVPRKQLTAGSGWRFGGRPSEAS